MMHKKYSIYHLPLLSFFSRKLYREVGQKWKGRNLAYLFLLLALCWLTPILALRQQLVHEYIPNHFHLINQIPELYISNGHVVLEQHEPLYITLPNQSPVAIIDTTGSMNFIYQDQINALLTETKLILRIGKNRFTTIDLSQIQELHLDRAFLHAWFNKAYTAIPPALYACLLALSYLLSLLAMFMVALVGQILALAMHNAMRFAALLRIAAVAETPSIILITLSTAFGIFIPLPFYAACTLLYLVIGIRACRPHLTSPKTTLEINLSRLPS